MDDVMRISGRCYCGHVAYEADVDPANCWICHCADCQKFTGSPFRVSVTLGADDLRLTANPAKAYIKVAESGRRRHMYFCSDCGSQMFTTGEGDAAAVWAIRWGSIDQRRELVPNRAIYCRSAVDWIGEVPSLPGLETV